MYKAAWSTVFALSVSILRIM